MSSRKSPDPELILEIATELGVHPSFIEKDWYAVQILSLIAGRDHGQMAPVFSGGTSLSKGYGLIQRFSEDIDFKIITPEGTTRGERRTYRRELMDAIGEHSELDVMEDSLKSRDGGNFFSFDIGYPQQYSLDGSLRPNLQLEMSFKTGELSREERPIHSFVSQFLDHDAETHFPCVTPVETATDKFSALLWRVRARDRSEEPGSPKNDPTIIRHLHDLAALGTHTTAPHFLTQVQETYVADLGRGGTDRETGLDEAISQTLQIFEVENTLYSEEYRRFVEAMSYAADEDRISFDDALGVFTSIARQFV